MFLLHMPYRRHSNQKIQIATKLSNHTGGWQRDGQWYLYHGQPWAAVHLHLSMPHGRLSSRLSGHCPAPGPRLQPEPEPELHAGTGAGAVLPVSPWAFKFRPLHASPRHLVLLNLSSVGTSCWGDAHQVAPTTPSILATLSKGGS